MKLSIFLFLLSFSTIGHGQQTSKSSPISDVLPLYFLDSVSIELSKWHFDPNKLSNVNVVKNYYDSTKRLRGAIFMTSKDPGTYNFLSITDIVAKNQQGLHQPTIFMLDSEVLTDTTSFKIDSSYILKVEITSASQIDYLRNTQPDLTILKIITKTKENLNKFDRIRIRGTATTAMK